MTNTREEDEKLAQSARRSASNEATLIWGLLGGFLSVLFVPLRWQFGLQNLSIPAVVAIAFSLAGLIALAWYLPTRKKIEAFKRENNDRMKAKKAEIREAHLETLKQRMDEQEKAARSAEEG